MTEKVENKFVHDKNRDRWANKAEYLLSVLGYAIGIGNVWRFPYLCYRNGGGVFLVIYTFMLLAAGIPLFIMEVIIGQFSSTGAISMYRMSPLLKGTGFAVVIINFLCCLYYVVIVSYPVLFIFKIMQSKLPWEDCNNPWNTDNCLELSHKLPENGTLLNSTSYASPADEFFHHEVLKISSNINEIGGIVWPLFGCLFFSWAVVYLCIIKGVKTVGKAVYFTVIFPFVIIIIMLIRGVTLPGAMEGIIYYVKPDFNRFGDLKVWADAATQMFYSVGPGWGGIVCIASFNDFRSDIIQDAIITNIVNLATSIVAGFVVFSVLGYLSYQTNIPIENVATHGPGLTFVTYPEAIKLMPLAHLWAALFFTMLFFLGLSSMFVQIEAIINSLVDEYVVLRGRKGLINLGSCIVMFLLSTCMVTNGGIFILSLVDYYAISIAVITICLVESFIVGWLYGPERLALDMDFMIHKKAPLILRICWKYITPLVLLFVLITTIIYSRRLTYNEIEYPDWAIAIGWMLAVSSVIFIPLYVIYKISVTKGTLKERIKSNLKAIDWYPANLELRKQYEEFLKQNSIEL